MSTIIAICVDLCRPYTHMNARPWPVPLARGSAGCAVHLSPLSTAHTATQMQLRSCSKMLDCLEYILILPSPAQSPRPGQYIGAQGCPGPVAATESLAGPGHASMSRYLCPVWATGRTPVQATGTLLLQTRVVGG